MSQSWNKLLNSNLLAYHDVLVDRLPNSNEYPKSPSTLLSRLGLGWNGSHLLRAAEQEQTQKDSREKQRKQERCHFLIQRS